MKRNINIPMKSVRRTAKEFQYDHYMYNIYQLVTYIILNNIYIQYNS